MHRLFSIPLKQMRSQQHRLSAFRLVVVAAILASIFSAMPAQRVAHAQLDQQYQLTYASSQQLATQVGTTFNENLSVRVSRLSPSPATPVNGVSITFTAQAASNGASGTFASTGTNTVTIVSSSIQVGNTTNPGFATAPAFTANGIAGSYTIRVTVDIDQANNVAVPVFFFMNNTSSQATKAFQISAGDGSLQATLVNTSYPTPFFANVFNGNNEHLAGVTVTFTAPATGPSGTFATTGTRIATAVTNGNGVAVAPTFTANGVQGGYSVTASVSGDQTVSGEEISTAYGLRNSTTNVLGVPETVSASSGSGQQVSVNTLVPTHLQVAVFDGSLDHVVGATVTFELPETGPSGLFTNGSRIYTTSTDSRGLATAVQFTTNAIVGQISVLVTATKNNVTKTLLMSVFNGRVLTTTTVTINPSGGSVYGQPVVVSARVTPVEGSLVPAGPVNFQRNGSAITGCQNVTPVGGVATCAQNWLEPGNYTFSANYLGDEVSQPSASTVVNYTVTKASTAITFVSSHPEFVLEGESVTITATASPVAPGAAQAGEPTGTILFTASDGTLLNGGNPVAVVAGVASITTSELSVGNITITAVYSGDGHFFGSSNTVVQNVYTIPEVTNDPIDTLVLVGNSATFTAAADGFPTPTVQWQVSTDNGQTFTDINGATSATLTFSVVREDDQKQYRAVFTNPAGSDTSAAAILTVRQPPSFTSAASTTFTVDEAGSFTVTADGLLAPTISLTGGTLPDGVTFDAETGLLSGTPLDGSGGEHTLTFLATNGIDPDATQTFTLYVNEPPEITSDDATTFLVGENGSFTFVASGYPAATFSTDGELPDGITLTPAGVLSGTPTTFGVYTFTVTATNGIGTDATQVFTLTINQMPEITSADATTFTVGVAGSFMMTATGFPTPTLSLTGELPDGVSFDAETGELSGTAADGAGGVYTLTLTATNVAGTDTQTFTLTVTEAPEITTDSTTTFTVGSAGSFTVLASGHPAATFTTSDVLPDGVSLGTDGLLSGTPANGTGGTYTVTIVASNGIDPDATQLFTLTVNEAPEITSADATTFVVGQAGSFTVLADGFPAATFSVTGTLPSGVTFSDDGLLTGTPADGAGGVYSLTITASNGVTPDATQTFTLTVNEAPEFTSDDATTFVVDQAGSFQVSTDGFPQSSFSVSGTLPAGVTLNSDGLLAGTPVNGTGGVYTLVITATNGIAPDATQTFTLTVNEAPVITSAESTTFIVGQAGSFTVTADGFPTATFSMTGTLPAGVTFSNGLLSGTPADGTGGVYSLTFTAANGTEPDATQAFTLTVNEAPEITSANSATFDLDFPGSFTVTASGYPVPTFSASGVLPNGVSLSPDGTLSGTPTEGGVFTVTITASNGVAPNATQTFTLNVLVPTIIAPANMTVPNDNGQAGAIVNYPAPQTIGRVGVVTCTPVSGSFFGMGTTTVTCVSSLSPATASFTITVVDNVPPTIVKPANIALPPDGPTGRVVTYPLPTVSDNAPGVKVSCNPPSGSLFRIGVTTVTCVATDAAGNTATATFTVSIMSTEALLIDLRGDTIALVSNAAAERTLVALLDQARAAASRGNFFGVYSAMVSYIVYVERYQDSRTISNSAAWELIAGARLVFDSIM